MDLGSPRCLKQMMILDLYLPPPESQEELAKPTMVLP